MTSPLSPSFRTTTDDANNINITRLAVTVTPPSSPSSQSKAVAEFPYRDSDIENLSEEEIADACNAASKEIQFGIARIAQKTIVKFGGWVDLAEARNMEFVARNAPSIRVPRVIRTFQNNDKDGDSITYIVMEFIAGDPLSECWNDMSEARRENVCNQVIDAITSLRAFELQTVGPIGGKDHWDAPCVDLFSSHGTKAKSSIGDLERWYDFALNWCKRIKNARPEVPAFKDYFSSTLAMTHLDIAPRNIIAQEDDTICIIDWEYAGAYPAYFERIALEKARRKKEDKEFLDRVLERLPGYKEEIKHHLSVRMAMSTFVLPD